MDERNPIYAKAHITISVAKGPHMRTVGRVERAVDTYIQKIAKKTDTSESKTHD
jgi:hypothetical protein